MKNPGDLLKYDQVKKHELKIPGITGSTLLAKHMEKSRGSPENQTR
jgi:hypothetical protein